MQALAGAMLDQAQEVIAAVPEAACAMRLQLAAMLHARVCEGGGLSAQEPQASGKYAVAWLCSRAAALIEYPVSVGLWRCAC